MMNKTHRYRTLVFLAAIALLILGCGVTYSTIIQLAPEQPEEATPETMDLARRVLQERYDQALEGKAKVEVQEGRLQVSLSRAGDRNEVLALASKRGEVIFYESSEPVAEGAAVPANPKVEFSNQDIVHASAMLLSDPVEQWVVSFALTHEAQTRFAEYTQSHIGSYLVIALDGVVVNSPVIQAPIIEGKGQIAGPFDKESAELFVVQLSTDPLPFTFSVVGP